METTAAKTNCLINDDFLGPVPLIGKSVVVLRLGAVDRK